MVGLFSDSISSDLDSGTFSWAPSVAGSYLVYCSASYSGYYANGTVTTGYITVPVATPAPVPNGYINPKYLVVGVIYAPPGSSSYVEYADTNSVGNTTTISNSFQSNIGYSVSIAKSFTVKAAKIINGTLTLTATQSTDYAQSSSSSSTATLTKTTNIAYKVPGTPTLSPINSDYDYIELWLNPELLMTYAPASGNNPASVSFDGYAFDPNDPASGQPPASGPYISGPDIVAVQVGCLDGDFPCPADLVLTNGVVTSGVLARSWASSADGYQWPAGEGPGLTTADIDNILSFDPLIPQNNYTLLESLPAGTTTDGRFTRDTYPPNPISYTYGELNTVYGMTQMNAQTSSRQTSHEVTEAFSLQESMSAGFFNFFKATTTLTQSQKLDWKYSTLHSLTTTNTLANSLSITGPPNNSSPAYNGPIEFLGYQDNLFGTFAFVPVN
jgi:hypothetical protein